MLAYWQYYGRSRKTGEAALAKLLEGVRFTLYAAERHAHAPDVLSISIVLPTTSVVPVEVQRHRPGGVQ